MDLMTAIKGRRSCRNFLPEAISEPTPMNRKDVKEKTTYVR